jgi:sRNA-binding protein
LRQEKALAEKKHAEEQAVKAAEKEKQRLEAEAQKQADEDADAERLRQEKESAARGLVEGIKLGGWIVVENRESPSEAQRLKLAVRINASRKLVFVDRLGMNRREFIEDALIDEVVTGNVRVLGAAAEFDDTLSRVVGRIRVGKH